MISKNGEAGLGRVRVFGRLGVSDTFQLTVFSIATGLLGHHPIIIRRQLWSVLTSLAPSVEKAEYHAHLEMLEDSLISVEG